MTSRERDFPCTPESVPAARRFVREILAGQDAATVGTAELMACELVTNCVRHAHTDFEVRVTLDGNIRVEVTDTGGGEPQVQSPPAQALSGRGLRIVQGLAEDWGVSPAPGGKTVWFTLAYQQPPSGGTGGASHSLDAAALGARGEGDRTSPRARA
jgi:anti-sigma regulatory factor (Ser/Thr protein kinase)